MTPRRSRLLVAALLLATGSLPALATTIVPIADGQLVDRSPAIALVTVEARLPTTLERPVTDWLVVVERVMKGRIAASRIVVRLPGGRTPDGRRLHIYGTPPLAPGRRALLFLTPGKSVWRVVDFPQGAFVALPSATGEVAWRDYTGVLVLSRGNEGTPQRPRHAARFADWIEDRADGRHRSPDYFLPAGSAGPGAPAYSFFEVDGLRLRWFQFDSGGSITYRSGDAGQAGLPGGGGAEVQRALAAWNNEPTTPLRLVYGGVSGLRGGTKNNDGFNVVLWNDPTDEIEGSFSCGSGGTLAHGGPWYLGRGNFDGRTYYRILEGDVVFNDGIECYASILDFSKFIEQVAAHEIGHTLGLGHSSENPNETNTVLRQALMYYRAHRDNRGAQLGADDVAGLQALYRTGSGGGGGGGTTKGCPAGTPAGTLCLLGGRFRVTATWQNQFDGSSGGAGAVPSTDYAGFLYFASPENLELAVKILDFGSEIKVFYSQLTNLRFTLTVTDSATGRTKSYSNTAGDCGAIDDNFLTGAAAATAEQGALALPSVIGGRCVADATTLCLLDNRFAVTVDWRNQFDGSSGTGKPKPLSRLTGAFSFSSDPGNLELLIKTLDFGDRRLVLYGSLSNLEYTIRVTDASTGETKSYFNPAGQFCGGLDEDF